jgi:hypothetical protein
MSATLSSWRIMADEAVTCNCAWGCPCQFNALPTRGRCEALVAVRIRDGHYNQTSLAGVSFAAGYWWPGPIHEGQGIVQWAIDESATAPQREAILAITSGKEGGTLFEIFAAVTSTVLEPIYAPFEFETDGERRISNLWVKGLGEFHVVPIKNPVTGEEHRASIHLPNGFEYKSAEVANCESLKATVGDKRIATHDTHAHFASVIWTNAR